MDPPPPTPVRRATDRRPDPPGQAAAEDGRKQVTVLFADIQDSIELIATYDAEVVREIFLRPLLDRMIDAVRLHGGTLTSVGGDGIMAAFGTPRALEDHAVRACNAVTLSCS
ncbi:MAG: hypothetical protein NVS2B11_12750 [Acetobacteraceae bacterium]